MQLGTRCLIEGCETPRDKGMPTCKPHIEKAGQLLRAEQTEVLLSLLGLPPRLTAMLREDESIARALGLSPPARVRLPEGMPSAVTTHGAPPDQRSASMQTALENAPIPTENITNNPYREAALAPVTARLCFMDGCDERRVKGAKYCRAHASRSNRGRPPGNHNVGESIASEAHTHAFCLVETHRDLCAGCHTLYNRSPVHGTFDWLYTFEPPEEPAEERLTFSTAEVNAARGWYRGAAIALGGSAFCRFGDCNQSRLRGAKYCEDHAPRIARASHLSYHYRACLRVDCDTLSYPQTNGPRREDLCESCLQQLLASNVNSREWLARHEPPQAAPSSWSAEIPLGSASLPVAVGQAVALDEHGFPRPAGTFPTAIQFTFTSDTARECCRGDCSQPRVQGHAFCETHRIDRSPPH